MHGATLHHVLKQPGGYRKDGYPLGQDRRGGPTAQRIRRLQTPGGGRVCYANAGLRQQQRRRHYDRGEGRGYDQGYMAQ